MDVGDELEGALCYTDGLSDTATAIQTLRNIIECWCQRWSMSANTTKTLLVCFKPKLIPITDFNFMFGDVSLTVSDRYKYLWLVLTDNLDYNTTASIVAKSASRVLGLLIAEAKADGGSAI